MAHKRLVSFDRYPTIKAKELIQALKNSTDVYDAVIIATYLHKAVIHGLRKRKTYKNKHSTKEVPVEQLDSLENVINTFDSQADAERATGILRSAISMACNNNRLTAGGYAWRKIEKKSNQ